MAVSLLRYKENKCIVKYRNQTAMTAHRGHVSSGFEVFKVVTLRHTDRLKRLRLFRASPDFNIRNRLLQQFIHSVNSG